MDVSLSSPPLSFSFSFLLTKNSFFFLLSEMKRMKRGWLKSLNVFYSLNLPFFFLWHVLRSRTVSHVVAWSWFTLRQFSCLFSVEHSMSIKACKMVDQFISWSEPNSDKWNRDQIVFFFFFFLFVQTFIVFFSGKKKGLTSCLYYRLVSCLFILFTIHLNHFFLLKSP